MTAAQPKERMAVRAAIRADASAELGQGHVTRCLALAQALRERGADVSFVSRAAQGDACAIIEERGFAVARIEQAAGDWERDAHATRRALERGGEPQWLIVDHYGLDERWERAMRKAAGRILVVDDLANRAHDCDVLLDQNLVDGMELRYKDRVPPRCTMLLGPRYALLQPLYRQLRSEGLRRRGPMRRILVSFGGVDLQNMTGRVLQALREFDPAQVEADVVLGPGNPHAAEIAAAAADRPNVRLHQHPPSLAPLLAETDLAIGAGGSTTWERLCLGVHSLVITVAENQKAIAEHLHRRRLICWLGHGDEVSVSAIQCALQAAIASGDKPVGGEAHDLVDGLGAARVSAVMLASWNSMLRVRPASASDEALLLEWANDGEARRHAFAREVITPDEHHRWFIARLNDRENCLIYLAEIEGGVPVGQVRFEKDADAWRVSYSLAAEFRGRGLGHRLLDLGLHELARARPRAFVTGIVKRGNDASQRIFRRLSFDEISSNPISVVYRRML